MSNQDREERRELRRELFLEAHNNPAALKTKLGQERLVDAVIARRRASTAGAIDPIKIKRWLTILMELLPLLLKLFA